MQDLNNTLFADSYGTSLLFLLEESADICTIYGDARRNYSELWDENSDTSSIWEATSVIGVTDKIYNDTVSISKTSEFATEELITALQESFIEIAATEDGNQFFSVYSHLGYQKATSSDYDSERRAQLILDGLGDK